MAGKTNTEKIADLEKLSAALVERIDTARKELEGLYGAHSETARILADLRRDYEREMALLKREVDEFRKWKEEQKKVVRSATGGCGPSAPVSSAR